MTNPAFQRIPLTKIHRQYEAKHGPKPWILKQENGKLPVDLNSTLGLYNNNDDRVVVFRAVNISPRVAPANPFPRAKTALTPKDPNARLGTPVIVKADKADEDLTPKASPVHDRPPSNLMFPILAKWAESRAASNAVDPINHTGASSSLPAPPAPFDYQHHTLQRLDTTASRQTQDLSYSQSDIGPSSTPTLPQVNSYQGPYMAESVQIKPKSSTQTGREALQSFDVPSPLGPDEHGGSQQKSFQILDLFQNATPEVLEKAVEASVELLNTLRTPLDTKLENSPDAEQVSHVSIFSRSLQIFVNGLRASYVLSFKT